MPQISVCIVNHNGLATVAAVIEAARREVDLVREIILVDNASTDGSPEMVEARFPEVRVLALDRNYGPGVARNAGYRAARRDVVVFLDNDVVPEPGCLARLVARLAGATFAMPRLIHAAEPDRIQYDGAHAHFTGLMTLENAERPAADVPATVHEIGSLVTACFVADRRLWGDRLLHEADFFMYFEDHDLGLRARQLGHRILSVPDAVCRHGSGTRGISLRGTGEFSELRVHESIRNRWQVVIRRFQGRTILLLLPCLVAFELAQLGGAITKGWFDCWFRAMSWTLGNAPRLLRERRAFAAVRVVDDGDVLSGGPIPFNPRLNPRGIARALQSVLDAVALLNWRLARPLLKRSDGAGATYASTSSGVSEPVLEPVRPSIGRPSKRSGNG